MSEHQERVLFCPKCGQRQVMVGLSYGWQCPGCKNVYNNGRTYELLKLAHQDVIREAEGRLDNPFWRAVYDMAKRYL